MKQKVDREREGEKKERKKGREREKKGKEREERFGRGKVHL